MIAMMKPLPDLYFYTRHGLCPCQLTFMAFYHRNRHTNVTHCESLYMMKQSLSTQNIGTASKPSQNYYHSESINSSSALRMMAAGVVPFSAALARI
jgi:hypothetical protein